MTDLPLLISTLEEGDHGLVGSSPEGETACPRVGPQLRAGKERPILFSAPMIRALLAGTKTQTRRVVKPQPARADAILGSEQHQGEFVPWIDGEPHHSLLCPYGKPGDSIWVRETTRAGPLPNILTGEPTNAIVGFYSADGAEVVEQAGFNLAWWYSRLVCPPIHMPRWASRITLRITDVRVERLKDISETDALAEGIQRYPDGFHWEPNTGWPGEPAGSESMRFVGRTAAQAFHGLWEMINGRESLDANPWLWCVSFERVPA